MEIWSDGAFVAVAAVSLSAVVAISLSILAIGALRRAARRVRDQIRELRRHPQVGDLPAESDAAFRSLTLEINHLIHDLRSRLQDSDRRSGDLRALVDGPPDIALVHTDPEWRVVFFSRGAAALTLWEREEILDHHIETLFAPGEWERILPKLARRSLREAGIAETVVLQRRDRATFPARLSVAPAPEGSGLAGSILFAARDLTAEKDLEQRLRDSEERHRRLVEGIADGVFVVQGEKIVYANPALARMLGVAPQALAGSAFKEIVHARDLLRVLEALRHAERGGADGAREITCRLMTRSGPPVEARIAWTVAEVQGRRSVIGTVADLTERIHLERELLASQARLQATLNATGDGILVLGASPQGSAVTVVNRAFCELFGLFPETMPGLQEADLIRSLLGRCREPERLRAFLETVRAAPAESRLEGLELALPRRALIDLQAGPVRGVSGDVLGLILTAHDMTAHREAQAGLRHSLDELARAKTEVETAYREVAEAQKTLAQRNAQLETLNAELRSLDEMKSNLLANVSHELHTPLVSIKGYTEMVLKRRLGPLTPEQERGLAVALKNIDRLVEMIDNLLSFSRMEKGETQLHLEDVAFWQLVDEAIELVGERARKRSITVTTQYETDELMIRADRVRVGQVLTNLLTNAIKFNTEGGRITVTARRGPRGFLEIDVTDTGIGIPAEEQQKIFERFYQVDSSPRRSYEGTGIGLAIVRDLLRLHGCAIRVESEPGKGSTFTFTLPLSRARETSEARPPGAGRDRARE